MISILGVGGAYPETVITNQILSDLAQQGEVTDASCGGIQSRRSALPLSYLLETRNVNPEAGLKSALQSPTDLVHQAADKALEMAGISKEQLGLIIGDSTTATQSTPSEAQRLGEKWQLKVDAYDVLGGGAAQLLQLNVVSRWKSERTPEYVLLVSANTPTQRCSYSRLTEATYLGDAASAMVVSRQHHGRFRLIWSRYSSNPTLTDLLTFDRYAPCTLAAQAIPAFESALSQELAEARRHAPGSEPPFCILSGLSPESEQKVLRFSGIPSDRLLSVTATHGHSLGSQVIATLAQLGGRIPAGASVILVSLSAGSGVASAVLQAQG